MFAGPNGSGKTTQKSFLSKELIGVYLNPDEIEAQLVSSRGLDLEALQLSPSSDELRAFFKTHKLLESKSLTQLTELLQIRGSNVRMFPNAEASYVASVLADFIRRAWLHERISFTFETVMSSVDKVELLEKARTAGYRVYVYYVCTEDPDINVWRVKNRLLEGGHAVPEE